MTRLSEEQRDMIADCKSKKNIAAASRKRRSHCGKSGSIRFPSDSMSKKERDAMNGELKTYNIRETMTQSEFESLPKDIQKMYLKRHHDEPKFKEET